MQRPAALEDLAAVLARRGREDVGSHTPVAIASGYATTGTVTFPLTVDWDGLEATEEGECHERKRILGEEPRQSAGE